MAQENKVVVIKNVIALCSEAKFITEHFKNSTSYQHYFCDSKPPAVFFFFFNFTFILLLREICNTLVDIFIAACYLTYNGNEKKLSCFYKTSHNCT